MGASSIDTFAATNPAFCSIILYSFVDGFTTTNTAGMPFPLILLPLPLVLTRDIADSFDGTNAKTGLLSWVARSPEVTVGMRDRLRDTADISKQAFLFGSRYGLFELNETSRVMIKPDRLIKKPPTSGNPYVTEALRLARRLGGWIGSAGSTQTIFVALGVNR